MTTEFDFTGFEGRVNKLCAMWKIDPDALFDAVAACEAVIANKLSDHHADCRTAHVLVVMLASIIRREYMDHGDVDVAMFMYALGQNALFAAGYK